MTPNSNYRLLIDKLDQFIRKYYVNKLIRGSLYTIGLIGLMFLVFNLLEYQFYFSTSVRKGMLWAFFGVSAMGVGYWVLQPLAKYLRLGKVISHQQAAQIIGNHFAGVKDKLLNILQLKQQADQIQNNDLILAGIDQKSEEIKLVPFKSAINLSQNRKYLRYALPPLLVILVLLFAAPSLIKDSSFRLFNAGKTFVKPAPFQFEVLNKSLKAVQYEDYTLEVGIEGNVLPNEVFIDIDGYEYKLKKEAPNRFTYLFSQIQKDIPFQLRASDVFSEEYELDVMEKPNIVAFETRLDYPEYTGRRDELLASVGDLVVPEGTNIGWYFRTKFTENIQVRFESEGKRQALKQTGEDQFSYQRKAKQDERYTVYISNENIPDGDSVLYSLRVIPDQYPVIRVEKFVDSMDTKVLFFAGDASDDYGMRSLSFNYRVQKQGGKQGDLVSIKLPKGEGKATQFTYTFDSYKLNLQPGDQVSYYFEVFDNDGVNGSKSARSDIMSLSLPTKEQMEAQAEANNDKVKDLLEKAVKDTKKLQEEMKKLQEKMLQEKEVNWQTKKELEKLMEKQKEVQKQIEQAKQAFEQNKENTQSPQSQEEEKLQEKMEQVEKLFEEAISEDMKELMEKIEELMQKLDKEQFMEMSEEMQFSNEELEKELERLEEVFKQLEVESEMQDIIEKLEELAEKQEELSEKTEEGKEDQKSLQEEQKKIEEEFEKTTEKLEETRKKNEELENPKEIEETKPEEESIEQDMNDSQEQMENQENQKASQSQSKASKKMKSMASKMQAGMKAGEEEQQAEDIATIRQILENLVTISFDQEGLINRIEKTQINTPSYTDLVQKQFKLGEDFQIVDDSLQALAKRVPELETFVLEKVGEIKRNIKESLGQLEERQKTPAAAFQQYTMKNVNDLALMLSESMNNMQQNAGMAGGPPMPMPGKSKGNSQGSNGPKDKMSKGQGEINKQTKELGKGGAGGSPASSKEFAQLAAKQAQMRRALQQKQKELQQRGQGDKELQKTIDEMDKIETELVNKRFSNELLKRQEEILTRLLEHEKAERERGLDEQRQSKTAQDIERPMPASLQQYLKKREAEIELYKTVSPALKPYYKTLTEEYLKRLRGAQ